MGNATVSGSVKVGTKTYAYTEIKHGNKGGGSRGLSIWVQGERGRTNYEKLDPNPHDSKRYNKDQAGFYEALARLIATAHQQSGNWPAIGTSYDLLAYGGEYTLTDR